MYIYLIENKRVAFPYNMAHNDGKSQRVRAGIQIHLPFRACWKKVSMLFMQFAPLGRGQWAVTGKSSQIAEVTVSRTHCAITPTKGHTVTPEARAGVGTFLYAQGICSKPEGCQDCPRRC
jgi:hypothetical protein